MVHLAAPAVVACMKKFSERYPWDWAADIGAIPPRSAQTLEAVAAARGMASALIAGGQPGEAFIIGPACEHFRPAALVTATPLDEFSASSLRAKGIELIC